MKDTIVGCLIAVVLGVMGAVVTLGVKGKRGAEGQDVVCYSDTGEQIFFSEGITVRQVGERISLTFPDGRTRVFVSGSCEWAPHDPEGNYKEEDIRSWQGGPEDREERNA